ncbi:GFA family protein [Pseudomonas sp. PL-6]
MNEKLAHVGRCFCGAVEVRVRGEPQAMGFCHCESCRHWSAGPVNAFSLWRPQDFELLQGAEHLGCYAGTPGSRRHWCTRCGGHLFTEHPQAGLVDVYAALLPSLEFRPSVHVHYQERVLAIADGMPKFRDLPAPMGGSGRLLDESA